MQRMTIAELLASQQRWQAVADDLRNGAIAAIPTDTLYGLAADGNSQAGVDTIYRLKGREENKPLILFLNRLERLSELGIVPTPETAALLARHWPGALTAVFPLTGKPLAAFPHPTLGIRIPAHEGLLQFLRLSGLQLLTTSVNRSGQPPLQDPDAIAQEFGAELDFLIDGGVLPPSPPSTVISCATWPPKILRQGKILID